MEHFKEVTRYETEVMNESLLRHYDQWILLLHRSGGSSVADVYEKVVRSKVEGPLSYFDRAGIDVDREVITYMIDMQLHSSLYAISPDRSPEDALRCMELDCLYHIGGWAAIKDKVIRDD